MMTRGGICLCTGLLYVIHIDLFPTYFISTSFGICSTFSRLVCLAAPIIAETENKLVPLGTLVLFLFIGLFSSTLLVPKCKK